MNNVFNHSIMFLGIKELPSILKRICHVIYVGLVVFGRFHLFPSLLSHSHLSAQEIYENLLGMFSGHKANVHVTQNVN